MPARAMHRNQSVDVHRFAMIPKPEIPRSSFRKQHTHKTTFDAAYLVPVYLDEVLPGDTFTLRMTAFARLATPIYPIMDNMYLDSFFFFVPCRLLWQHWVNFMGEQANPTDSIAYTIPTFNGIGGWAANSLGDYFGLPTVGQVTANGVTHSMLPLRAYNRIWNEWFRDENLQNSVPQINDDGTTDSAANYVLLKRGKRPDYFTTCLPWTQKGGNPVTLPLAGTAIVKTSTTEAFTGTQIQMNMRQAAGGAAPAANQLVGVGYGQNGGLGLSSTTSAGIVGGLYPSNLYADLSTATGATINQLRQSFQIQRLLERDARGGTRYTEIIRAHFGVVSPDARLQRSEYLGGGTTAITVNPVAQTSATAIQGGTTPQGNLAAYGTVLAGGHGFTQSFTEHGYIIGLVNVRADLTYQQGLRRLWTRNTRYDFYFPAFAMLGEQAVLNQEIYCTGTVGTGAAQDQGVFGYQERWGELRYMPSMITGQFRSTYSTPLDAWHLAEKFTALPTLSAGFITSSAQQVVQRVSAGQAATAGAQFICDMFFDVKAARPLPLYSVPGLIDHF